MPDPLEVQLAYVLAGLLATSSVLLLFLPLLRHVSLFVANRLVSGILFLGMLIVTIAAVALVLLAISNPAYFAPVAGLAALLRIGSPSLLYWRIRERFDVTRGWAVLQLLLLAGFLGLAVFLAVHLVVGPAGGTALGTVALSEQFLMAVGASALLARFALRARPKDARAGLWPVWLAALLFGVALLVVAPYTFPEFAVVYALSGIAGWTLGAAVLWRDR